MLVGLADSPVLASSFIQSRYSAAVVERRLIPAGPAYLAHVKRTVHKLTFEEHDRHAEEEQKRLHAHNANGANGEDDLGVGDEEETEDLLTLDPKEWKVCFYVDYESDRVSLTIPRRNKIIMLCLDFRTSDTGPLMSK